MVSQSEPCQKRLQMKILVRAFEGSRAFSCGIQIWIPTSWQAGSTDSWAGSFWLSVGLGRGLQSLKDSEDDVDLLIARKNLKFEIRKIMKGNKIIIVETFYLACERCNIPWKIDSHHMRVQAKSKIQSSDSKDDWTWYIPPKDYRRVCNKKKTISIVNICLFLKTCRHNTGCGRETYFFERLIKTKLLQISV